MGALQLSNIDIAVSAQTDIDTFHYKEHLASIAGMVEKFHINKDIIFSFSFICIHKKFLGRFVNFLMSLGSFDLRHFRYVWFFIILI